MISCGAACSEISADRATARTWRPFITDRADVWHHGKSMIFPWFFRDVWDHGFIVISHDPWWYPWHNGSAPWFDNFSMICCYPICVIEEVIPVIFVSFHTPWFNSLRNHMYITWTLVMCLLVEEERWRTRRVLCDVITYEITRPMISPWWVVLFHGRTYVCGLTYTCDLWLRF